MIDVEEILYSIINLTNTYYGEGPLDIDNCQWIMRTSGPSDDHFNKDTYDRLGFKIYVRRKSNEESKNIVNDIYKKLKSYVGYGFVIIVNRLPYYIGSDVKYRHLYSLNIEFQIGGY